MLITILPQEKKANELKKELIEMNEYDIASFLSDLEDVCPLDIAITCSLYWYLLLFTSARVFHRERLRTYMTLST